MKISIVTACAVLLGCVLSNAVSFADGDVRARRDGLGRLEIIGDAAGNSVTVTAVRRGYFVVVGHDGTTINGLKAGVYRDVKSIDIRLHDGEDSLRVNGRGISSALEYDLRIETGNDGDEVTLENFDGNNISVLTMGFSERADDDWFVSRNVSGSGTLAVFTGKDHDQIDMLTEITGYTAEFQQGIVVDSGRGTLGGDVVKMVGLRSQINLTTSDDADDISILSTESLYPIHGSTGGGNDNVVLEDVWVYLGPAGHSPL